MFVKQLFVLVCLIIAVHGKNRCEHYNANPGINADENPCTPEQLDSNGVCNITTECEVHPANEHVHCYSSWTNVSGTVTLLMKGCWSELDECIGRQSCFAEAFQQNNILFCCCEGDMCNSQFSFIPTEAPPSSDDDGPSILVEDESSKMWKVLAYTLVPIVLFSFLVVLGYWWYRKRKQTYDEIDIASVETPGSGVTTSTAMTNLHSPGQADIKFPHLIEMKARGRFGCVWKAQLQDRIVAVKIFYMQDKQSWQNEQDIFNTDLVNDHPNILRCITATSRGVGVQTELWLITEFHELGSLADYLKVQTLSLPEALRIMETMACGLSFLHEDIIYRPAQNGYKPAIAHRDFKSKNVLISNQKTAIIADFGLAVKFVPGESTGESHGQVGTRRYMAPEILEGAINFQRDAFLRIDMYALALVIWEITTRCYDATEGASPTYYMPYELELGQHPTLEEMQDCVVEKKIRPNIEYSWRQHPIIGILCETIEECWDHDAEARLSAGCVEERIRNLQQRITSPPGELPIHSNILNSDIITNAAPLTSPSSVDTDVQNQINAQKNEIAFIRSSSRSNEEAKLLNTDHSGSQEEAEEDVATPVVISRSGSSLLSSCDRESNV